jgi:hypothetical protein
MHQIELESFIRELGAVSSMRAHLPMDILQEHIIDIEREISLLKDATDIDDNAKENMADSLKTYKQILDKELDGRGLGNNK